MALHTRLLSSLHKVYPDFVPQAAFTGGTLMQNEPFSFQIAYKTENDSIGVYIETESEGLPLSQYRVDYVPLLYAHSSGRDGSEERQTPGLYPDVLQPRQTNPPIVEEGFSWQPQYYEQNERNLLHAIPDSWQSLWFTVNEDGGAQLPPGEHAVTVRFCSRLTRETLAEETVRLTVLPALLPPQTLLYTNWLHCDCLCDIHRAELFSDRFYAILGDYVRKAVQNGMNMIFLPAFTPPLDTPVGKERMTVQLVGVTADPEGKHYSFDFTEMKRYLDVCRRAGATHFEHSHLFTQWGAKAAPKIIATVNGEKKRIFGWETKADGGAYGAFLAQYLPALRTFLRGEGLDDKILYHVSDEPMENVLESYRAAVSAVRPYLDGCMVGDALSNYSYYEQGLVQTPIVATNHLESFLGRCPELWCYYTGEQEQVRYGLSNRLLCLPSARNRVIGMQIFRHHIKGFLQWGYNFCYGVLSHGVYDPAAYPGGYAMTTGGAYCTYPGRDDTCLQSIRQKVFGEGVNDMRALQLLEQLTDFETACQTLDAAFGQTVDFHTCPQLPEQLLAVREAINQAISMHL